MAAVAADPVGRERELAAIADFLEPAAPARAVVVEGEPGIGKTRVWQAAVETAAGRTFRVLKARPAESEAKLAFSSLADLLGAALDHVLVELPSPQRRALEVALLLDDPRGARADRRAVSAGLLTALRLLAAERPLLIAIDDVQWLDASSGAVVEFALRRLSEERVALLIARRLDAGSEASLEQALSPERVLTVAIGPLDFISLNAVLHERLEQALSRPLLRRIHELSGGNPFFALELARAPERLKLGRELPPTLDALVSDRISAMPEQTRSGLLAVAAASQVTVQLAEEAIGVPGALAPAEAAHIVEVEQRAVRFTHPILGSAAYAAAEPAQRREVHAKLASLVPDPEERARHLAAAAMGADEEVAAALEHGAARARARGAPAAAAELSEQAVTLTPPGNDADLCRRMADAGYFHFESGDSRKALALLEQAAGELQAGPERAGVLCRLARVRSYSDDLEAASGLFLQAADEAGDDRVTTARALEGAATQLFRQRRQLSSAVDHAKRAAKLAAEQGDEALLAEALGSQLLAEATLGRPAAARTLGDALEHQPAAEAERILAQPKWSAAIARLWWDDPATVRETYEDLVARGLETGDEGSLSYVYLMLAQADLMLGEFGRAEADATAAKEIAEQAGQETLVAYAHGIRAFVDAQRGRADESREAAELALELGQRTQGTPAVHVATSALGLLELSIGNPAAAAARLAPLAEFARAEQICEPGLTRYVPDQVEALVELGRVDEAEDLLAWYEENAARLRRRSALAAGYRCRGLLAASSGAIDEALEWLERALEEHQAVPFPFERARTQLAYGAALRRAKRKADARNALEEAKSAFAELGATVFAERASSELRRIGGRRPSDGGLTATERQIAELVAEGRSNKEVAAALFVSVKTVEANLSRTYAKLGIHSRAALAKRLAAGETAGKP